MGNHRNHKRGSRLLKKQNKWADQLVKRNGRLVWTGQLPSGVNSATALNQMREEI
jgi:hypothetical protein